jgi:D-serine deaminase-like pyridoxal phosphate-dependent protein
MGCDFRARCLAHVAVLLHTPCRPVGETTVGHVIAFEDQTTQEKTPCLVVDAEAFAANVKAMAQVLPGLRLRPHVKAFKCTELARKLAANGHTAFTCATLSEVAGMIHAGLGADLLLANETLNVEQMRDVVALPGRVTIAVDSPETIAAAAAAGVTEVLIDVNVGLPRCGCPPGQAGVLADVARAAGLTVRGVMGYEGHLMMVQDRVEKTEKVSDSMALLAQAAADVGTDFISAGGTGTFDTNTVATEIQAGSYALMDTHYATLESPFVQAIWLEATIISANTESGYVVADSGLKSMGMDHGNPAWAHGKVWFCSDEHVTMAPADMSHWSVGDRVRLEPAHIDPTIAKHERMWFIENGAATEWPVDLRHW